MRSSALPSIAAQLLYRLFESSVAAVPGWCDSDSRKLCMHGAEACLLEKRFLDYSVASLGRTHYNRPILRSGPVFIGVLHRSETKKTNIAAKKQSAYVGSWQFSRVPRPNCAECAWRQ